VRRFEVKAKVVAGLFISLMVIVAVVLAVENKGAKDITLAGGKSGTVLFPHHRHQDVLVDCKICHSVFPQKAGIIEELKAQGKLKKKQVMNKLCTKCHKQNKRAGEKGGPVTCKTCHIKK
jgi:DNA-directed RNA polymerase subunit M/transcription elongation factor TFIIS